MKQIQRIPPGRLAACLLAIVTGLHAQNPSMTGHYPAGVEGIKAGSVPPPGVYLRDYNVIYKADTKGVAPGNTDIEAFNYINAPRLIWITEHKILGADFGVDALLPMGHVDIRPKPGNFHSYSVGDLFVEPILLGWHGERYDLGVGYGFWAPTGDFDQADPSGLAKGFWSHMITLGGTYYMDAEKTWAASALGRFEMHQRNGDSNIRAGESLTVEWGVSKTLPKGIDVGVVGYLAQQLSDDSGPGASPTPAHVLAVGPEISGACPFLGLMISVRYLHEFDAEARPEGGAGVITFTKRF